MNNSFVVIGRIKGIHSEVNQIEVETIERDNKQILKIELNESFLINIKEYCKINEVVGVHGFIQNKEGTMILLATRLTFLKGLSNE